MYKEDPAQNVEMLVDISNVAELLEVEVKYSTLFYCGIATNYQLRFLKLH